MIQFKYLETKITRLNAYSILISGIILCLAYFSNACQSRKHDLKSEEKHSLTIICDSTFDENLFYDLYLYTKLDTIKTQKIKFDSLKYTFTFHWDSLKTGDYHFELISVFQQKNKVVFKLNNDTTIQLKNKFRHELINVIPIATTLKSDTISFAFQTNGCSYGISIYTLIKNNGNYRIKSLMNQYMGKPLVKDVSPEIIKDLYETQIACRNHKSNIHYSTRSYQFMVLTDNKVFYFDDKYFGSEKLFDPIRRKYLN